MQQTRNSRVTVPQNSKAPTKLQLTTPPSVHNDGSGTENGVNSPNLDSASAREQDLQKTESSAQRTAMQKMPQSLSNLKANSLSTMQ